MNDQNGHNGPGAAPHNLDALPIYERIKVMRRDGWQQNFGTGRVIRLRTLDPYQLLREGDCPDILTPLLLKSLYTAQPDQAVQEFLEAPLGSVDDAFAYQEMLDLIAAKSIADETKVEELTLAEKKLIFRFSLGSPELLVSFKYQPPETVAGVAQGDDLPQTPQRGFWGGRSARRVDA